MKYIIILIIIAIAQIIPCLYKYQDTVYNSDKTAYEHAKTEYDVLVNQKRNIAIDSLMANWTLNNDTALRKIKKIRKIPEYDSYGYYRKTGRLECETKYNGNLVCEPEKEWITTDYYIVGYRKDTIWTDGYKIREEWMAEAYDYAKKEAKKLYPEFHPYNGHEYHYLIKSDSGWNTFLLFLYIVIMGLCVGTILKPYIEWLDSKGGLGYIIGLITIPSILFGLAYLLVWIYS